MARPKKDENVKKAVKFISEYQHGFSFIMEELDETGKPIWQESREGDRKSKLIKEYKFVKMPGRDPATGKIRASFTRQFFVVDPAVHGKDYDRIYNTLLKMTKNPDNRLYFEDDYLKKTNPHAFSATVRTRELEETLSEKEQYIKDLEAKLGL